VGDTPGLTRQVAGFQVATAPDVYVLDTPGVMLPAVPSDEVGLRLALAGGPRASAC
jgi:ribosome biogenesis GTPase A